MKTILLHTKPIEAQPIRDFLQSRGHVICANCITPEVLPYAIAKHEPHMVILSGTHRGQSLDAIAGRLHRFEFLTTYVVLPESCDPITAIELIGRGLSFIDERRMRRVQNGSNAKPHSLYDSAYRQRIDCETKAISLKAGASPKSTSTETNRFLRQIKTARENHASAKAYLETVAAMHRQLTVAASHDTIRAVPKTFALLTQLVRYLAVLAHYTSQADLSCLPLPCGVSPRLEFIPHSIHNHASAAYALSAVMYQGIEPGIAQTIRTVLSLKFEGQNLPI